MPFAMTWMLHVNDEGATAAGKRRVAVNIVMPHGADATTGESALAAAGDLMWPWRWEIDDWWALGEPQVLSLSTSTHRSACADRDGIHALLEAELYNKCAACEDVFSPDLAFMRPGVPAPARQRLPPAQCAGSSLPHVFAPLTMLPATLSQEVLGVVRRFECDDFGSEVAFAPQFSVTVGSKRLSFTPAAATMGEGGIVDFAYECEDENLDPYDEIVLHVLSNRGTQADAMAAIGTRVQGAEVSEVEARAILAAQALSPMVLLGIAEPAASLPAGVVPFDVLMERVLGPGMLRMDGAKPITIWERLPGANQETGDDLVTAWTGSGARFASLRQQFEAHARDGSTLLAPLAQLFDPAVNAGAAGRLFDDAGAARVLMLAWLAVLALDRSQGAPAPGWNTGLSFGGWYATLGQIVGEHEVAELLDGWWRHWLAQVSGSTDARARELHQIVDRWIRGLAAPGEGAQLAVCHAHGLALLRADTAAPADLQVGALAERIEGLYQHHRVADPAAPVGLGEDRDLAVMLEVDQHQAQGQEQQLRGYAIAIAAGVDNPEAALDWQWVTDLACSVKDNAGNWRDLIDVDGKLLRCHDGIGAFSEKGRTVISFPYSGEALNGAMRSGGADSDGVDGLSFGWPDAWATPPLAYGLNYWTRATAISNAGRILDEDCRGADDRSLKQPDHALFEGPDGLDGPDARYLCRVQPGAIAIKAPTNAYEMQSDARAWHEQGEVDVGQRIPVAVIRPDAGKPWRASAPTEVRMALVAPDGTPKVIERWLNGDIAQRALDAYDGFSERDTASRDRSLDQLINDRAALLQQFQTTGQGAARRARHPAVRAIGVHVEFPDGGAALQVVLSAEFLSKDGYLKPCQLVCRAASGALSSVQAADGTLTISLAPGAVAKARFWTLAPEQFFSGSGAPLLWRMADFAACASFTGADGTRYRAFAPQEHWFECAPDASKLCDDTMDAMRKAQGALGFILDGHDAVARFDAPAGVDATWLKGFLVQRHDWHWTGYPLALPRMLSGPPLLAQWAEAFAGTESLVESSTVILPTVAHPAWRFGLPGRVTALCRTRLPGLHGARFVACVLRPLRRFDAWLVNDSVVESHLLAAGKLVPARVNWQDPALRLAPPTVLAAAPLVRTYEEGQSGIRVTGNGALLVLDDALCRTDAQARSGGVGEIVDVDLEETRINGVFEIGPNPIMHAGPDSAAALPPPLPDPRPPGTGVPVPLLDRMNLPYKMHYLKAGGTFDEATPMDWLVEAERPFGLTFDTGENPKVAHTAIVVRPVGADVATYWVMAKVRLRRLLDPGEDWTAHGRLPAEGKNWLLARRPEGDDWVPFDFAIGSAPLSAFELGFGTRQGVPLPVRTGGARRLLCSWHKGHWAGTSEALWGLQVLDQILERDGGQWRTVGRHSPYDTVDATGDIKRSDPGPVLLREVVGAGAQRLLLSDYGPAHWLTFIGMPFRHPSIAAEGLWMQAAGNAIELSRSSRVYGVEQISRDLLLNPVNPGDYGATPGERAEAETNTFHLLLVYARVNDIATPRNSAALGQLVGVYKPTRAAISANSPYPPLRFVDYMNGSTMPADAIGYIYKFQSSMSAPSGAVEHPKDWADLLSKMFPPHDAGAASEVSVRWVPEVVGPIMVGAAPAAKALKGRDIRIDLAGGARVELQIAQQEGWRLQRERGAHNPWQGDLKGGVCTAVRVKDASVLALEGAGGRLLARLYGWEGEGVEAIAGGLADVYDDNGARHQGTWSTM